MLFPKVLVTQRPNLANATVRREIRSTGVRNGHKNGPECGPKKKIEKKKFWVKMRDAAEVNHAAEFQPGNSYKVVV